MPNVQLIGIILLLAVAVVAAYFYMKRVEQRPSSTNDPLPPAEPAASEKDLGA